MTGPDFSLTELLAFRWRPTLDGQELSEAEIAALAEAKRPMIRMRGRWVRDRSGPGPEAAPRWYRAS